MRNLTIPTAATLVTLVMAGCSAGEDSRPSSRDLTTDTTIASNGAIPSGSHVKALGGSTAEFGETRETDDGLVITLGGLERFEPSKVATAGRETRFIKVRIRVVNKSRLALKPADIFVTAQSGGQQAGDVIDPKGNISIRPPEAVKPGGQVSWTHAFGVENVNDVTVVIQARLHGQPIVFSP